MASRGVDDILTIVRDQTDTSSSNISDAKLLTYLNFSYQRMKKKITQQREDYFWDIFTFDTVADQNEYTIDIGDHDTVGIDAIKRVEIKRTSSDTYHTLAESNSLANFNKADAEMQEIASQSNAWREARDGSVFIYPAPDNSVTGGGKLYAEKMLIDLVSGGAESTIFPNNPQLRQYHDVLILGTEYYVYNHRKRFADRATEKKREWEYQLDRMVGEITKYQGPVEGTLPNGLHLSQ